MVAVALRLPQIGRWQRAAAPRGEPAGPSASWRVLAPEGLIAFPRTGAPQAYRLRHAWDGVPTLQAVEPSAVRAWVAVIDTDLPLRRKLQRFPATAAARQALLKAAPDEFPLAGKLRYAIGHRGNEGYLFALPEDEYQRIIGGRSLPASILIAGNAADPAACLAALADHARLGPAVDFLHRRPGVSRRVLRQVVLGAFAATWLAAAGGLAFGPDLLEDLAAWQVRRLQAEIGDLPRQHAVTESMGIAQAAAGRLAAMPEARAAALLARLMNTVPPGHSIRRIEISGGVLRLAGSGADVQAWLAAEGFPAASIVTERTGNFAAWRAELKL